MNVAGEENHTATWIWWSSLVVIALSNVVLYAVAVRSYNRAVAAARAELGGSDGT